MDDFEWPHCLIGALGVPHYWEEFPDGLQDSWEKINLKMIFSDVLPVNLKTLFSLRIQNKRRLKFCEDKSPLGDGL